MPRRKVTQAELVKEYFIAHPNQSVPHPAVVDWAVNEYKKRTGQVFRDPDRQIRKLGQEGFLIKDDKGVYRYDPDLVHNRKLEDFTPEQKEIIKRRDGYKCVICGRGLAEGVELQVDHIKAKDFGGQATIENGQTLCAQHNFLKKNFKQTETGKKMFIRLYDLAKAEDNLQLVQFCASVLEVFERFEINGHIKWKR